MQSKYTFFVYIAEIKSFLLICFIQHHSFPHPLLDIFLLSMCQAPKRSGDTVDKELGRDGPHPGKHTVTFQGLLSAPQASSSFTWPTREGAVPGVSPDVLLEQMLCTSGLRQHRSVFCFPLGAVSGAMPGGAALWVRAAGSLPL